MTRVLPLNLLLALVFASAPLLSAQSSFVAEGVVVGDTAASDRFYDTGKGYFWGALNKPYAGAWSIYNSADNTDGSLRFLGALYERLPDAYKGDNVSLNPAAFDNLRADGNTCWYQTSANVLEYWQSYYGVFADGPIVSGHTYDQSLAEKLGGTQSLNLGMLFYDNFNNAGNDFEDAIDWYLKGVTTAAVSASSTDTAGGFANYFNGTEATYTSDGLAASWDLSRILAQAMGGDREADGTFIPDKAGQIAFLYIKSVGNTAGSHAVTAYGYTTDADGKLKSIYITNSDDMEYGLTEVFVQANSSNKAQFYKDEACTEIWDYAGATWYLHGISNIETPQELQDLYEEYAAAGNELTWSGGNDTWNGLEKRDAVASAEQGWMLYSGTGTDRAGFYNSYYEENRDIYFTDAAASGTVKVGGDIANIPTMTIDNSEKNYAFTGDANQSITADAIVKKGTATASMEGLTLNTENVNVTEGTLALKDTQVNGDLTVNKGATLIVDSTNDGKSAGADLVKVAGTLVVAEMNLELTVAEMLAASETDFSGATPSILAASLDLTQAEGLSMARTLSLDNSGGLSLNTSNEITLLLTAEPPSDSELLTLFSDFTFLEIDGTTITEDTEWAASDFFALDASMSSWDIDALSVIYDATAGTLSLAYQNSIPEPSTPALLLLTLTALTTRRRRLLLT